VRPVAPFIGATGLTCVQGPSHILQRE